MSDKPKRRWLQIHLSTAIFLMLTSAGLLGLNFTDNIGFRMYHHRPFLDTVHWHCYGFPFWSRLKLDYVDFDAPFMRGSALIPGTTRWYPEGVVINAFFAVIVLLAVAYIAEWRIRRRATLEATQA